MFTKTEARTVSQFLHAGIKNVDGSPRMEYIDRVIEDLDTQSLETWEKEAVEIIGLLHDTIETGLTTLAKLVAYGLTRTYIEALEAITREPGESQTRHIDRVCQNVIAAVVKRSVLRQEMSPSSLASLDPMDASAVSARNKKLVASLDSSLARLYASRAEKLSPSLSPLEDPSSVYQRHGGSAHEWGDIPAQGQ